MIMSDPPQSTTTTSCVIPTSISRTALDSLHAKLSAIDAGWLDGGGSHDHNDGTTQQLAPSSIDGYCKLLGRIRDGIDGQSKSRRQTPLVNAGYAARMAVMTFILERWINNVVAQSCGDKKKQPNTKIECVNVVMLGCGMDASGIWSKELLQSSLAARASKKCDGEDITSTGPKIKVYEFDAWDNCILKRQALVNSGILQESVSSENSSDRGKEINNEKCSNGNNLFSVISKGQIKLLDDVENNGDDYFLAALDLREIYPPDSKNTGDTAKDGAKSEQSSTLSKAMHSLGLDPSQPTIVLSELVLAYLGYEGANATMQTMAKEVLSGNEHSMFACLEPVFPSESEDDISTQRGGGNGMVRILSVEESYSRDYSQQFLGKLQRGNSKYTRNTNTNIDSEQSSSWLHPLGSNASSIQMRLEDCGFSPTYICYSSLANAVASVAGIRRKSNAPEFLRAKEPFDEHAALALNLNCYGVVCAFSTDASLATQDWIRDVCPWRSEKDNTSSSGVQIESIASSLEDGQVRDLYGKTYVHLYTEYPAVRKMVKSALKMDLRANPSKVGGISAIRNRFKDKGGDFWVAKDTACNSRIMGCIGVGQRRKRETEKLESMPSSTVVDYEIQRLAVDDGHRGKGIGKKLLSTAEEYTRHQAKQSKDAPTIIKVWAVTPECLTTANGLYESFGYKKEETFQAGTLCMNVYCKSLSI